MAPLTRNRAGAGFVPGELAAEYYGQRASAGLLISEATQISQQGQGYQDTPGIYTQAQIDGWRKVTDAVHAKGGRIFLQLWHVGRVSHVDLQENGAAPVAPSAIRAETKTFVNNGFVDVSEPRALELDELPGIVNDFRQAAANAIAAGFDGVEIHGANGYLLDQFAKDGANVRTDAYGGSVENRARLMLEVTAAVVDEIGAERTGIRISPVSPANGVSSSDPQAQFDYIVDQLDALGIVYIHVVEGATGGPRDVAPFDFGSLRRRFEQHLHRQQRLRSRPRDVAARRGQGRPVRLRAPVHRQSRPGGATGDRRAAGGAQPGDALWRRRRGLHRLSRPRGGLGPPIHPGPRQRGPASSNEKLRAAPTVTVA